MGALGKRRIHIGLFALVATGLAATSGRADEIQLKDGKKLYGVIVAYEDNMFKVKTDFGFVLVEKDKIAKIVPSTPVGQGTAKQDAAAQSPKPPSDPQPQAEPAVASSEEASATPTKASTKSVTASPAAKADKARSEEHTS